MQFPAGCMPTFQCPQQVLAAFKEQSVQEFESQQHLVGKFVQYLSIPLATGGVSLWAQIRAHKPTRTEDGSFETVGPSLVLKGQSHHWIPLYIPGAVQQRWSIARQVSVAKRATNKKQYVLNAQTLWVVGDAWIKDQVGKRSKGCGEKSGSRYALPN